jgi:polyphosphate kinase
VEAARATAANAPIANFPVARPAAVSRLFNRELSWLEFDRRVLELASDRGVPLLERLKLCAIVSSNLDEFVAVRMAGLRSQVATGLVRRSPDGLTPAQALKAARRQIIALQADQDALWLNELQPDLAAAGFPIVSIPACNSSELSSLTKQFRRDVQPLLTPIAVGPAAPLPAVPSLTLSVAALITDSYACEPRLLRIKVPQDMPRFLEVGGRGTRVLLEDVVLHFLPTLVEGESEADASFRITRNANFRIADGADDLLNAVEEQVKRRRFGEVVRLEISGGLAPPIVDALTNELRVDADQVFESRAPLGLVVLRELLDAGGPSLRLPRWKPVTRKSFKKRTPSELFARIRQGDLLVQHPYDAYDTSVGAFVAAASDPKVAALKATAYRTGNPAPTLASLVETACRGKHGVCLVELQARFDEQRNIEWSLALERAGVEVVYGVRDLKVHAKLTMLVRREHNGMRRYVHIGTGNYHASNASSYEDLGLFTADEEICADVADIFNAVTGLARPSAFRKLLVAPWFMREGLLHEIERVVHAAHAGEKTRIRIKVNSLVDPELIEALYTASSAGVTVEIITRGICVLRPGIPGVSERISVRSVLGRFLEHSRILSFQTGEGERTWIGSPDLMPRNLDGRIEVLAPIEDARLRAEIAGVFETLLADTRFSWTLDAAGSWKRTMPVAGERPESAQDALMAQALERVGAKSQR